MRLDERALLLAIGSKHASIAFIVILRMMLKRKSFFARINGSYAQISRSTSCEKLKCNSVGSLQFRGTMWDRRSI